MKFFNPIWSMIAVLLIVFYIFNFTNVLHSPTFNLDPLGWSYVFSVDFAGVSLWHLIYQVIESKYALWLKYLGIAFLSLCVLASLYINLRVFF